MNVWYNFAPMNEAQKYLLQNLSVAIVDDHALILEGFKSLMQGCNVRNVETFICSADLISIISRRRFDIYIIDIGLPDIDGFELIDKIRSEDADARIIVNTIHEEVWLLRRMLDKDVNAILFKSTDFMQMVSAITAVMNGEQYFCPGLKKKISKYKQKIEHPSQRETDILVRHSRRIHVKGDSRHALHIREHRGGAPQAALREARGAEYRRPDSESHSKGVHKRF